MSLRYKKGDRVVMGNALTLEEASIPIKYAHETGIINCVYANSYTIIFEDGEWWNALESQIDHEATAKLKDKWNIEANTISLTNAVSSAKISISNIGNNLQQISQKIAYSKGGEIMNANEILEKWRNKKADELISQQDEEIKKVTKEDEIQKLVKEHETEINKIIKEKYKVDTQVSQIFCTITTRKTGDKIEAINKEFDKKVAELGEKEEEIKAVLEVAENQDKVFEILNKQGIIDKNYNIL